MISQDKIRASLRRLINERGLDMAAVSKAIGKNHAYIQQYLNRGVPAELGYRTAMALADYLDCGLEMFGMRGVTPASNDAPASGSKSAQHPIQSIRRLVGLDPEQFARALGEKPASILAIEQGTAPLSEKMLLKICRTFQIDPDDLSTYAPALSPEERVMLLRFRQLTPAQHRALDTLFRKFEKERA